IDYTSSGTMPTLVPKGFSDGDLMSVTITRAVPLSFTYQGQKVSYWGYSLWREDWICVGDDPIPVPLATRPKQEATVSFIGKLSVTIAGSYHNLGTSDLHVTCYDDGAPKARIQPDKVLVDIGSFDVTINFVVPQTGSCT